MDVFDLLTEISSSRVFFSRPSSALEDSNGYLCFCVFSKRGLYHCSRCAKRAVFSTSASLPRKPGGSDLFLLDVFLDQRVGRSFLTGVKTFVLTGK